MSDPGGLADTQLSYDRPVCTTGSGVADATGSKVESTSSTTRDAGPGPDSDSSCWLNPPSPQASQSLDSGSILTSGCCSGTVVAVRTDSDSDPDSEFLQFAGGKFIVS